MMRKTLLVVEDNDDLRGLYRDALAFAGYSVREAADGLSALQAIDASPPEVIVLDLAIPHVSGYGVLQELRLHAHTRGIPVIIVTGTNDSLENVSVDCVLRKPVEPDRLLSEVEQCIARQGT